MKKKDEINILGIKDWKEVLKTVGKVMIIAGIFFAVVFAALYITTNPERGGYEGENVEIEPTSIRGMQYDIYVEIIRSK